MLAPVAFEVVVVGVVLGAMAYRVYRSAERNEGLIAATFLEVRKVLGQPR